MDMINHIHLVQFGTGNRRISQGTYGSLPALFIEPCDPHEIGTFGVPSEQDRTLVTDGTLVFTFSKPESIGVVREIVDDLMTSVRAEPTLAKLTEGACYVIEAAWQYGFTDDGEGTLTCTETQLINFIDAAREQGRKDAEAARG